MSRSDDRDGGFSAPQTFAPDDFNNNLGGAVSIGRDTVVLSYFDMSHSGAERPLWAVTTRDQGTSFERALIKRGITPWGFPMLAVDHGQSAYRGRIYAVWLEGTGAEGLDVLLAHSNDFGATWSVGVMVNSNREPTFCGRPFVAVNPDGVVGVTWNDRRRNTGNQCSDIYFSASLDGGDTFLSEIRVSTITSCPHDEPANARASERWPSGGDYSGMAAGGDGIFRIIWADARDGVYALYLASVDVG